MICSDTLGFEPSAFRVRSGSWRTIVRQLRGGSPKLRDVTAPARREQGVLWAVNCDAQSRVNYEAGALENVRCAYTRPTGTNGPAGGELRRTIVRQLRGGSAKTCNVHTPADRKMGSCRR